MAGQGRQTALDYVLVAALMWRTWLGRPLVPATGCPPTVDAALLHTQVT
jgi:hypothetical protein